MDTMLTDEATTLLTTADRCEATCSAGAMVRIITENVGTLLFCGHHYDLAKKAIPGVIHVHDERNPL